MILTGENRSTGEKTVPVSVTTYTTNLTRTGLGLKHGFRSERAATDSLSHEFEAFRT